MAHKPRNSAIVPGIERYSRARMYKKKALYKRKKVSHPKPEVETATHKKVPVKGDNNGKERLVPLIKAPRFYSAEDVKKPKKTRKVARPTKLRSSITPGTVLILLAGRFRGKRVVFLKQLNSGLLLVTGPYKVNGVPLKRVNQVYVIATSTKLDIGGISLDKFSDEHFKKEKAPKKKGTEEEFFGEDTKKKVHPEDKVKEQKELDKALLAIITKTPHLRDYLNSRFSLSKGQAPHNLKF